MNEQGILARPAKGIAPKEAVAVPDFEDAYDEPLSRALDLGTWTLGEDLISTYARIEQEVASAVSEEARIRKSVREIVFGRLQSAPGAPNNAGVYQANRADIERVHVGLLFNGAVEACDGISIVHDTLPLTITQLGICLVSYNGEQGSWAHRLFRRDLRSRISDPVDEVLSVLERREKREAQGIGADRLSELARRGIMAYAERAVLREKSNAQWRMGHGSPAPVRTSDRALGFSGKQYQRESRFDSLVCAGA